jgi:ABC-type nitrate/sulfonate/bicarbonate transport system substrate-binding protein
MQRTRRESSGKGSGRRQWIAAATAAVSGALLLAACSSPGSGTTAAASGSSVPPTSANGTPNLKGVTIRIAVGSTPALEDTKVELMANVLKSWGANAQIINQTGDPAAIRVILAGDADIGSIAVSSAINSGLTIFGPSQPRLDYHFVGAPTLKSMSDLAGHVYGTSNTHGLEALMFADLLAKYKIPTDKVQVTLAGGASVRVSAMLTHHIDATFVHQSDMGPLLKAGFTDLAEMSSAAPDLADSFIGGSPSWIKAHPDLAVAVDEAWLKAAQIFNDSKSQWVQAALKYAGGSQADASSTYDALKATDTFPVSESAFSQSAAVAQEQLAKQVGAITSAPDPSQWLDMTPWTTAVDDMHIAS